MGRTRAGHSDWLTWLLAGDGLADFYTSLRWPGWRDDVAQMALGDGLSAYPFLWTAQAHDDPAAIDRRPVPMDELLVLLGDFTEQATSVGPGPLGVISAA